MPPKRFDQARPFLTLILVVVAWLIVPLVIKSFTRATFFEFQAPVSVAASYARDLQEYWTLRLHSNNDLIAAGKDLAGVANTYEVAAQTNTELQAEIARLQDLLKMPPYAEYRSEYARVVRREQPVKVAHRGLGCHTFNPLRHVICDSFLKKFVHGRFFRESSVGSRAPPGQAARLFVKASGGALDLDRPALFGGRLLDGHL